MALKKHGQGRYPFQISAIAAKKQPQGKTMLATPYVPSLIKTSGRDLLLAVLLFFLSLPQSLIAEEKSSPRVYGATFPSTFALYALSPDRLAGWNGPIRGYEAPYIPQKYKDLPILGGWYGQGFIPDREMLMAAQIDKALYLVTGKFNNTDIEDALYKIGISLVIKRALYLEDYITIFRELGEEFGVPDRGAALSAYAQEALERVVAMTRAIPPEEHVRVYLAQGVDGLDTVCDSPSRSEMLRLAGGNNALVCPDAMKESAIKISFEQLMLYDPDVLLVLHPGFMEHFAGDTKWQNLRAIKNGRIYFVPHEPFNWLDRPASFMRLIGIQWLACVLHPEKCSLDIEQETKRFINLFFMLDLDDATVRSILTR